MNFENVGLHGAYLIRDEPSHDERGSFGRIFCADRFRARGLPDSFVQMGLSSTPKRGTLRGFHFQREPKSEGKLVRCMKGRIFDAIVDLRRDSATFKRFFAVELDENTNQALYVPPGFAHGFLTLTDNVEVLYNMTEPYAPELADGVRWDDPAFAIDWPAPVLLMSERDRSLRNFA